MQMIVMSLCTACKAYTKHAKKKGLGVFPQKNLKIDTLKLHFVALSEQH